MQTAETIRMFHAEKFFQPRTSLSYTFCIPHLLCCGCS